MENASRALLIAGGIAIAIIIISMFLVMYNQITGIQRAHEEKVEMEHLTAFNEQFEAFNKKIMYGTDVITLINKVVENNQKNSGNPGYIITIYVDGVSVNNSAAFMDKKDFLFKCDSMQYNSEGRVSIVNISTK